MSIYLAATRRAELLMQLEMERYAFPSPPPSADAGPLLAGERRDMLRRLVELVAQGMEEA